jgi:hypothetical protein
LAALLGGARSRRDEYIMINPLLSSPSMPSIWTRVVCEGLAPLYTHTKNSSLRFVSSPTSPLMPYFLPLVRPVCVCLSTRDIPPPPPGCFRHGYIPTVLGFKLHCGRLSSSLGLFMPMPRPVRPACCCAFLSGLCPIDRQASARVSVRIAQFPHPDPDSDLGPALGPPSVPVPPRVRRPCPDLYLLRNSHVRCF